MDKIYMSKKGTELPNTQYTPGDKSEGTINAYSGNDLAYIRANQPVSGKITFNLWRYVNDCVINKQNATNYSICPEPYMVDYDSSLVGNATDVPLSEANADANKEMFYYRDEKTNRLIRFKTFVYELAIRKVSGTYSNYNSFGIMAPIMIQLPPALLKIIPTAISEVNGQLGAIGSDGNLATVPVYPGDRATFRHDIKLEALGKNCNSGTNDPKCSGEAEFEIVGDNISNPANPNKKTLTINLDQPGAATMLRDFLEEYHEIPYDATVGTQICRKVKWKVKSRDGFEFEGESIAACVKVVISPYDLKPIVMINGSVSNLNLGSIDEPLEISGMIVRESGKWQSVEQSSQWQLFRFILPADNAYQVETTAFTDNNSPDRYYANKGVKNRLLLKYSTPEGSSIHNSVRIWSATDSFDIPKANEPKITEAWSPSAGDRYCAVLSIKPHQPGLTVWLHSAPVCVTLSKAPTAQVRGGSLIVPLGNVAANQTNRTDNPPSTIKRTYSSWAEYDILTRGEVIGVTSNSGSIIENYNNNYSKYWHQLTFANTVGKLGQFVSSGNNSLEKNKAKQTYDYFKNQPSTAIVGNEVNAATIANSPANKVHIHNGNTPLTVNGGNIAGGKYAVIIKEEGDIEIKSNIVYKTVDKPTKLSDYAQIIIIAKNGNIIIDENVTQVDAWLIASGINSRQGRLKTCGRHETVSAKKCDKQLIVNGPVVTDYVDLMRTYGSDKNKYHEPAEIFNFRPDAYLWLIEQSSRNAVYRTTITRDIVPRY